MASRSDDLPQPAGPTRIKCGTSTTSPASRPKVPSVSYASNTSWLAHSKNSATLSLSTSGAASSSSFVIAHSRTGISHLGFSAATGSAATVLCSAAAAAAAAAAGSVVFYRHIHEYFSHQTIVICGGWVKERKMNEPSLIPLRFSQPKKAKKTNLETHTDMVMGWRFVTSQTQN